jgi:hypothetical protein
MFVDDVAIEAWIKATAVVPVAGVVLVIDVANWLDRRHAKVSQ